MPVWLLWKGLWTKIWMCFSSKPFTSSINPFWLDPLCLTHEVCVCMHAGVCLLVNEVAKVFTSCYSRMVFWWMSLAYHRSLPHEEGMGRNNHTSTWNTFIYKVTFIHTRPFDLRTLHWWSRVRLCIITANALAWGLVAYWTFLSLSCSSAVLFLSSIRYWWIVFVFILDLCIVITILFLLSNVEIIQLSLFKCLQVAQKWAK